jgi:NAD(P)H-dependent FMN reductase
MSHIAIIAASIREGRVSPRVALYFQKFITSQQLATAEILDLQSYNFPLFEERLKYMKSPSAGVQDFASRVTKADGIIIVTPEYNGGYPASLKNVIDLLYAEWQRKPVAISTVSDGNFGGTQVITSLQFSLWKIRAWTVPAMFPVPNALQAFDEQGHPVDEAATNKRASFFVKELFWCIAAKEKMKEIKA